MREDSPDRYCPACKADWLDKPIPKGDLASFNSPLQFKEYADLGYPENYKRLEKDIEDGKLDNDERIQTHFSRRMGIYNVEQDRTVARRCPDCGDTI